jgi:phosphohistidine phosphatase
MELYILRHGHCVPRSEWGDDDVRRPLADEAVVAMAHEAWTLARLGVKPDLIITSPLERAQQTAGIVASGLGLEDRLRTDRGLGRGFGMKRLRRLLDEHARAGSIMLVGHEPELSGIIHKLTGGHVLLSKGGLACVHLAARKSRSGELVWLLQADELVGLALNPSPGPPEAPIEEPESAASA